MQENNTMHEYEYDVFLSFTGGDRAMKDAIRAHLESPEVGLICYNSDRDCDGDFRDNYIRALDRSRVYLLLLTDNLRNNPTVSGHGFLTEVRDEFNFARELEAKNQLNVVILCMSEFFRYSHPYHDYHDTIGWFFYSHTRGFSQIHGEVDADGTLSVKTLHELSHHCAGFVSKRLAGNPEISQAPRLDILTDRITENGIFKGRQAELRDALAAFREGKQAVVLTGLGGIGKTTLAIELARLCEEQCMLRCPQVVTLRDTPEERSSGLRSVISAVKFEPHVYDSLASLSEADKYMRKLGALMALPETVLLVIDNFNTLEAELLNELLSQLKCRLLITTRARIECTREEVAILSIGSLSSDEAYEMFAELVGREVPRVTFDRIYTFVGGHTITLCIMARMMAVHRMSAEELLDAMGELEHFDARVRFGHNEYGDSDTVLGHLKKLFDMSDFDDGSLRILRSMSILGDAILLENLKGVLGLKNRNEINRLVASGWLEIQTRGTGNEEQEYVCLHPILSRLMEKLLLPTEENVGEMITYLMARADGERERMTYADAASLADSLYHACCVLAGGSHRLSRGLWDRFVEVHRLLGDTEDALRRAEGLAGRIEEEGDRRLVTAYGDMVTLDIDPTRVEVLERLIRHLKQNTHDYAWIMSQLSVSLQYMIGIPEYRQACEELLDATFDAAMEQGDDLAVYGLLNVYVQVSRNYKPRLNRILSYIKRRRHVVGENGTLLYLEMTVLSLKIIAGKDAESTGKELQTLLGSLERVIPILGRMVKHPIAILRILNVYRKFSHIAPDGEDPFAEIFHLVFTASDRFADEGCLDISQFVQASYRLHELLRERKMSLISPNDAIVGIVSLMNGIQQNAFHNAIGEMVDHIDPECITIHNLSQLQVALTVSSQLGDKGALEQANHIMSIQQRLHPEGHRNVVEAVLTYANLCYRFDRQEEALYLYHSLFEQMHQNSPRSSLTARIAGGLLRFSAISQKDMTALRALRDVALMDKRDHEEVYYVVWWNYLERLIDKVRRRECSFVCREFDEAVGTLLAAAKKLNELSQSAQDTVLMSVYRLGNIYIRNKETALLEGLYPFFTAFRKSPRKIMRAYASIYEAALRAYDCYYRIDDDFPRLARQTIRLATRYHIGQAQANDMTFLLMSWAQKRKKRELSDSAVSFSDCFGGVLPKKLKAWVEESATYIKAVVIKVYPEGALDTMTSAEQDEVLDTAFLNCYDKMVVKRRDAMFGISGYEYVRLKKPNVYLTHAIQDVFMAILEEERKNPDAFAIRVCPKK